MATTPRATIAGPSVASLLLFPMFNDTVLGPATGFVVVRGDETYLVTNFHVVSGRRPEDLSNAHPLSARPTQIRVTHNMAHHLGVWVPIIEPLYDSSGVPRWLEHPEHGHRVDVVALPFTKVVGVDVYPYDPWAEMQAELPMASPLSVIGFPFGETVEGAMAIWVRGFVASEPDLDHGRLPRFLIDSRTRPGQSGSPVINYQKGGTINTPGGGVRMDPSFVVEDFHGVYSGRINEESDLGFVWKSSALREIIEGGVRGTVEAPE